MVVGFTKELRDFCGPSGDRTHYIQTEATSPAASCPARSFHATDTAAMDNGQSVWDEQALISTPVCLNFKLRPGPGDVHICCFNVDAYNP